MFFQTRKIAATGSKANGYWTRANPRKDPANPDPGKTATTDGTKPATTTQPLRLPLADSDK
jgi:hypothetical protein